LRARAAGAARDQGETAHGWRCWRLMTAQLDYLYERLLPGAPAGFRSCGDALAGPKKLSAGVVDREAAAGAGMRLLCGWPAWPPTDRGRLERSRRVEQE